MGNLKRSTAASVREALKARGIRQHQIAPVLGLSQQSVSDRLTGHTPFTLEDLELLADHLGISVAELLEAPVVLVDEQAAS